MMPPFIPDMPHDLARQQPRTRRPSLLSYLLLTSIPAIVFAVLLHIARGG